MNADVVLEPESLVDAQALPRRERACAWSGRRSRTRMERRRPRPSAFRRWGWRSARPSGFTPGAAQPMGQAVLLRGPGPHARRARRHGIRGGDDARGEAFEAAGRFDERFWMYFEETDLCRRFPIAGTSSRSVPPRAPIHQHGASTRADLRAAGRVPPELRALLREASRPRRGGGASLGGGGRRARADGGARGRVSARRPAPRGEPSREEAACARLLRSLGAS